MKGGEIPNYVVKKALKFGADDVVASLVESKSKQIKFVNNKIVATKSWEDLSAGVFVAVGKRAVGTNLKEFSRAKIDKSISKLIRFAKLLPPKEDYFGIAEGKFHYKPILYGYDKAVSHLEEKRAIEFVERAINAALERGARRATGLLEFGESKTYLVSSGGAEGEDKGTSISLSIRTFASKDASGHKISCGRKLSSLKPEWAGRQAAKIALLAQKPKQGKPGKYDVIFEPLALADLLGVVAGASSIYSYESGMSFFKKTGEKVASEIVTLIDSGKLAGGMDSAKFDAEGVPIRETKIIENGVFKNFLHNTSTARKYKTKTTANAGLDAPTPWNTILLPGRSSREKMFKQVRRGLWVTNVWYTTFQNYINGDFSTLPRDGAFLIENGKIKHAVKGIRISDNMLHILKNIVAVGSKKEAEQVSSWAAEPPNVGNNVFTPPVLCKGLKITRSLK